MNFKNKSVLVTGANRGIGNALVSKALARGARLVYACSRNLNNLPNFDVKKVKATRLDISNIDDIRRVVHEVDGLDVLINNAGILSQGTFLNGDIRSFRQDMEVNYFGTLNMMREFVPALKKSKGAGIVNIVSIAKYVNFPFIAGYCASKSALYSMSQAARIELGKQGISVHTVNPGAIATDMTSGSDMEMTSPEKVAESILSHLENKELDIVPDKIGRQMYDAYRRDPMELENIAKDMFYRA